MIADQYLGVRVIVNANDTGVIVICIDYACKMQDQLLKYRSDLDQTANCQYI